MWLGEVSVWKFIMGLNFTLWVCKNDFIMGLHTL